MSHMKSLVLKLYLNIKIVRINLDFNAAHIPFKFNRKKYKLISSFGDLWTDDLVPFTSLEEVSSRKLEYLSANCSLQTKESDINVFSLQLNLSQIRAGFCKWFQKNQHFLKNSTTIKFHVKDFGFHFCKK